MNNIVVTEARPSQTDSICQVLRRSIREVCGPDYRNDPQVLAEWLANKTPENVSAWVDNPDSYSIAAEIDGVVVGFALASGNEILLNYVLPEHLGQGVGHALLGAIEAWAESRGITRLECSSTISALSFYERHGFIRSGEPEYVGGVLGEFPLSKQMQ